MSNNSSHGLTRNPPSVYLHKKGVWIRQEKQEKMSRREKKKNSKKRKMMDRVTENIPLLSRVGPFATRVPLYSNTQIRRAIFSITRLFQRSPTRSDSDSNARRETGRPTLQAQHYIASQPRNPCKISQSATNNPSIDQSIN